MRLIAAGLLALVALSANGQTCPAATTTPSAARDEARLGWQPPTTNTDGTAISGALTYRVYRSTGSGSTAFAFQCQTSAATASLLAQPVGLQNYRVTASVAGVESAPSNVASKTVVAPTPNPPSNLSLLEQLLAWIRGLFSRFA